MKTMDKRILETDNSQHHLLNPAGRNGAKDSIMTHQAYSDLEIERSPPGSTIVIISIINKLIEQS
jgi:hypothetical protein